MILQGWTKLLAVKSEHGARGINQEQLPPFWSSSVCDWNWDMTLRLGGQEQLVIMYRSRTGHCWLLANWHKMGMYHASECPCSAGTQTPEHIQQACQCFDDMVSGWMQGSISRELHTCWSCPQPLIGAADSVNAWQEWNTKDEFQYPSVSTLLLLL